MPSSNFFEQEFSNLQVKDVRLKRRAISIGNTFLSSPGSCIQEVFSSKNTARCAYDFFSNRKIRWLDLLRSHQEQTVHRILEDDDPVYIIQDSTFYNYTRHKAKIDIGTIGKQGRYTQFGFLQHTALCISERDLPLGLLELDFIGYTDDAKSAYHRQDYESIASSRWRRFLGEIVKKFEGKQKEIIMLCDREADFFGFLDDLHASQCKFVIRGKYDRPTGPTNRKKINKFSQLFKTCSSLGTISLKTFDPYTHKEITKVFNLRALKDITLPPVHRGAGHRQNTRPPIKINLVEAKGEEGQWFLLTNLPVDTFEQASFIVQAYRKRWHIESFHKVIKTAYKAEQVYLHTSRNTIQNLLTMINIAAYKTYWLIHQVRQKEDLKACEYFTSQEIEALILYTNPQNFSKALTLTLKDIYKQIAQLGGHKNINNKHPPGVLTIYRGIKKLNDITNMFIACRVNQYLR